jgi:hypothetical protein
MRNKIDFGQLELLLKRGLTPSEMARRLGVHPSSVTRAIKKLQEGAPKAIALWKSNRYKEIQLDVMQANLEDHERLEEILIPVLEYLRGNKKNFNALQKKIESKSREKGGKDGEKTKAEQKIETFDFGMDPRLLATKIIHGKAELREFIRAVAETIANAKKVEFFKETVLECIGEVSPETRDKIIEKMKAKFGGVPPSFV